MSTNPIRWPLTILSVDERNYMLGQENYQRVMAIMGESPEQPCQRCLSLTNELILLRDWNIKLEQRLAEAGISKDSIK